MAIAYLGDKTRHMTKKKRSLRRRAGLLAALSLVATGTLSLASPAQADTTSTDDETWEQVQELAQYNGAIDAFDDPTIGPVIIFPKDYSGDIDNLSHPSGWQDSSGNTPTSWPTPTTAKSPNFTADEIADLESTVSATLQPNGDQPYTLSLSYDGTSDRVVAQTNAPSSVTDPLTSEYPDRLVVSTDTPTTPLPDCEAPHGPLASGEISDPLTQLQALAGYNCALSYFDDPTIGPVIIFPKDYTGDIDNLTPPPNWTDDDGATPSSWPTPTTSRSVLFTQAEVKEINEAAYTQIDPDGDNTYNVFVYYDGASDRMVVVTDAPSSVTDPLLAKYPGMITLQQPPS
ncbi:hypothetical protein [Streptomyces sp. SID13726]|uniref:hypothetical protein n=1 Tax=Streptomyces sp. SID13726 TaxID=2706058 RepID=UPI0013B6326F|nr:hypothetical protein [Streptomyces sp. SID13726]NEB03466.1 hypothetical protein [Streptomyces sp. SID13726]